ncbi:MULTISPECIES: flagellar export protein FliJ [unclassified Methylophaga]|jgi:flagellar FliJ protein|uniref:flagellar export protein FliJ n=1 Tax=unclassified Methylophaga TaxID=2629249 RepID=UPI00259CC519|nr:MULTISPECIES: flagellar export protein FliJ [unclassified Methylophaga]|tara:strand:- start:1139 stop:1585 length:447 start_codon:yes stop_codon:yes gene_type:complete
MSRSRKLDPVIEMARKATESELQKLGQQNALLQQEQFQLDDLRQYRAEYLARFRQDDPMVMTAKKALDLRSFLAKLDQAILSQESQVKSANANVERQQKLWLQARNKEQAIDALMARYEATELKKQLKREQVEMDEHTNSAWLRNRNK